MNQKEVASKITPAMKRAAQVYLLARTHAEMEREKVDDMTASILNDGHYRTSAEFKRMRSGKPERITEPKDSYLIDEAGSKKFERERMNRLRSLGYTEKEVPEGYCPALMAEDTARKAARSLMDICEPLVGLTCDRILCAGIDKYEQYLKLLMGLLINAPGFRSPMKVTNGQVSISLINA